MGLPFCIDKLINQMDYCFRDIEKDIKKYKFEFYKEFKKEMSHEHQFYPDDIFDFIYNLFYFKKAFSDKNFNMYLENFKDFNFKNEAETRLNCKKLYISFLMDYKKYFMEFFRIDHDDKDYFKQKFDMNKAGMINKLLEYSV